MAKTNRKIQQTKMKTKTKTTKKMKTTMKTKTKMRDEDEYKGYDKDEMKTEKKNKQNKHGELIVQEKMGSYKISGSNSYSNLPL